MRILTREALAEATVRSLGLDAQTPVDSPEALACAIRRYCALTCPCTRRSVTEAVSRSLQGLTNTEDLAEDIDEMIDTLVGYGDLLELRSSESDYERGVWRLHGATPSFVQRQSGTVLLLGVAPDQVLPLPVSVAERVRYKGHARLIQEESSGENLAAYLADFGLLELSQNGWLRAPPPQTSGDFLADVNRRLEMASEVASIPDLEILDSSISNAYYRRRWRTPKRQHNGNFVARRPQGHGANLWCYVQLSSGEPVRFLDLPLDDSGRRGCDEAWRIQAAIDASLGTPQRFRLRQDVAGAVLDFFAPLPSWAERRLTVVGEPAARRDSLFSTRIPEAELAEELAYLTRELWLATMIEGQELWPAP